MWMGCRASLTAAVLNVRRMGMRYGRAPQIAISPSRPAAPRALSRLCLFGFSSFRQSDPYALRGRLPSVSRSHPWISECVHPVPQVSTP